MNQMIQKHNEIQISFGHNITMLEHRFKDNSLYSKLVGNISRARQNFIFHKAKQAENVGFDSLECDCTLMKTHGLPRACLISNKVKLDSPA